MNHKSIDVEKRIYIDIVQYIKNISNADISVIVSGRPNMLHRRVLMSKSGTFHRILTTNRLAITELYVNHVPIPVFLLMLHYMYVNYIPRAISMRMCLDVYEVAVNYEMTGLLKECRKLIPELIDRDNFLEVFYKGKTHFDYKLRDIVRLFCIRNNFNIPALGSLKTSVADDEFQALIKDISKLTGKIIHETKPQKKSKTKKQEKQ